jgi:hypothetical protein
MLTACETAETPPGSRYRTRVFSGNSLMVVAFEGKAASRSRTNTLFVFAA